MKDGSLEPERVRLIQEQLCGFLLDEVISTTGEFFACQSINNPSGISAGTSGQRKEQGSGSGQNQEK